MSRNLKENPEEISQSSKLNELEQEARAADSEAKAGSFDFVDSGPEAAPPVTLDAKQYAVMWKGLFVVIARRSGAHWNLTDAEAKNLAEATGPVVDKYLPTVFNRYGAEAALAAAVFFICMPRMGKGGDEKESGSLDDTRSEGGRKVHFAPGAYREQTV